MSKAKPQESTNLAKSYFLTECIAPFFLAIFGVWLLCFAILHGKNVTIQLMVAILFALLLIDLFWFKVRFYFGLVSLRKLKPAQAQMTIQYQLVPRAPMDGNRFAPGEHFLVTLKVNDEFSPKLGTHYINPVLGRGESNRLGAHSELVQVFGTEKDKYLLILTPTGKWLWTHGRKTS